MDEKTKHNSLYTIENRLKKNKMMIINQIKRMMGRWNGHNRMLHKSLSTSRNQLKCNQSIHNYMRLIVIYDSIWEYLQLQNQISTILVILTTMMQLLKFSSYWLDQFYIHFHPLIG
jgi:hypothetical protein